MRLNRLFLLNSAQSTHTNAAGYIARTLKHSSHDINSNKTVNSKSSGVVLLLFTSKYRNETKVHSNQKQAFINRQNVNTN